ncbi:MAG: triple tyrosine motif-containing protein [Mangrovibacterium sp.]
MKRIYKSLPIILLQLILLYSDGYAQLVGIPHVTYYSRADYHGGTQNWKIVQSSNGLIYAANNAGLLEYDGTEWNLYATSSNSVTRSVAYIDDRIYVSNYGEVGYFELEGNTEMKYHSLYVGDVGGEVWNIFSWQKGVMFQSDKKVMMFEEDTLSFEINVETQLRSAHQANGAMLINQDNVGLVELRGNKLFLIKDGEQFADKLITGIVEVNEDLIIICTMNDGMYKWSSSGICRWNVSSNDILKQNNIYTAVKYDDCIVLGTIQSGLVAINFKGDIILHINKEQGLENNTVLSLYVDVDKNIWCGLDNGIACVNMNTSMSYLQSYYDIGTVYAVERFESSFYFGTNQGLYRISESDFYNPQKQKTDFKQLANAKGQVWTLHIEGDQLLCGHNQGVFAVRREKATKISLAEIKGAWVFRVCPNDSQKMLVGTYEGFCVLQKKNGSWQFNKKLDGYNYSARFVEFDDSGSAWVTHGSAGIDQVWFSNDYGAIDSVKHYSFSELSPDAIGAVVGTINGSCTFFSNQGFYRWNSEKGAFAAYTAFENYFSRGEFPIRVFMDGYSNLWYYQSGLLGVLRRLEDGSYRKIENPFNLIKDKLIPGFEFMYVVNEKDAIFAIEEGMGYYSSSVHRKFGQSLNLNLRALKLSSDSVAYSKSQIGGKNINQTLIPHFEYSKGVFLMKYSASHYAEEQVLYSSMLKGYDAEMSEWMSRNYREYVNLPAGKYVFTVQAKSDMGILSELLEFEFEVLPPWYLTTWARFLYVLLGMFLLYGAYLLVSARLKRKQEVDRKQELEVYKQREEQMKKETLEAEKEIERLRNETLQTQIQHKEMELANTTVNIIKKNDFLVEIKESLQEIRRTKHADVTLRGQLAQLITKINRDIDDDNHWKLFETHMDDVHEDFLSSLRAKHPNLSKREEQLATYIRMGMSSKEIASLQNISVRSVENNRSRLRQKIDLDGGENFSEYLQKI